jgi:hypothetical protein
LPDRGWVKYLDPGLQGIGLSDSVCEGAVQWKPSPAPSFWCQLFNLLILMRQSHECIQICFLQGMFRTGRIVKQVIHPQEYHHSTRSPVRENKREILFLLNHQGENCPGPWLQLWTAPDPWEGGGRGVRTRVTHDGGIQQSILQMHKLYTAHCTRQQETVLWISYKSPRVNFANMYTTLTGMYNPAIINCVNMNTGINWKKRNCRLRWMFFFKTVPGRIWSIARDKEVQYSM